MHTVNQNAMFIASAGKSPVGSYCVFMEGPLTFLKAQVANVGSREMVLCQKGPRTGLLLWLLSFSMATGWFLVF